MIRNISLLFFMLMLFACTKRYDGVYMDESGFNVLITCEEEVMPNGEELLFCSRDDRGTW